jgi:hypothetical protein
MTPEASVQADSARLLRLRALRERSAQAALAQCRREREAALAKQEARRQHIAELRARRHELLGWLSGAGAAALPRVAPYGRARIEALEESIEREVLDLEDDAAALRRADAALAEAEAAWLAAQARHEALREHGDALRRAAMRDAERRSERELAGS